MCCSRGSSTFLSDQNPCPAHCTVPGAPVLGVHGVGRAHSRGDRPLSRTVGTDVGSRPQVGQHGHSSVEDAMTAMELYRLVEVQWEQQEASSLWAHPEDKEPDSSTDMEQYMEDQYWPEDLAQSTSGGPGETQDRRA